MTQIYSDPERENDPHALPDVEVFYLNETQAIETLYGEEWVGKLDDDSGWYWWACMPGYMPDGDPNGPFETEQEAIADAKETN